MAKVKAIGSLDTARKCIAHALEKVPAYRKFLEQKGKTGNEPFEQLPCTTKKTYLLEFPYEELLLTSFDDGPVIFASSGSSGKAFYWVYQKKDLLFQSFIPLIEEHYSVDKKRTLVIIAASLGSWVGGDLSSFFFKSIALQVKYPLTVVTVGTNLDEIVKLIDKFEKDFDQILMVTSPNIFTNVILTAEHAKINIPYKKMCYAFIEEGFTEDFRIALEKKSGVSGTKTIAFSLFASADTGDIGIETLASVCLRKLCFRNQAFAEKMGVKPDFPHFFHLTDPDAYLEDIDGEIWVTKSQGIPLLRYNLNDRCSLYSWMKIQEFVKNYKFTSEHEQKLAAIITTASSDLSDVFAIVGKADSCINLGGVKIYEYVLDNVIRSVELSKYLTGMYKAKLAFQDLYPYIDMVVELKENVEVTHEILGKIEDLFEQKLSEINPEYKSFYEKLLKQRREVMGLKSVKMNAVPWPIISSIAETTIKIRGISPTES